VIGQFSAFRSFLGSSTAVSAAIGDEAPSSRVDGIRPMAPASSSARLSMIASNVFRVVVISSGLTPRMAMRLTSSANGTSFGLNSRPLGVRKTKTFFLLPGNCRRVT